MVSCDSGSYHVFNNRSYRLFGFFAGVRNYSGIKPISNARGLPDWYDSNYLYDYYYHNHSWLSVKELVEFDYEEMTEDRRCTVGNGGCTCEVGQGEKMSYREFLGEHYFKELAALEECGCTHVVFWFDN
jgi:hypothetical protein